MTAPVCSSLWCASGHHSVIDIVQLYGEHDADATRVPGNEPDVLFPRKVLRRVTGPADHVIDSLLGLTNPQRGTSWLTTVELDTPTR